MKKELVITMIAVTSSAWAEGPNNPQTEFGESPAPLAGVSLDVSAPPAVQLPTGLFDSSVGLRPENIATALTGEALEILEIEEDGTQMLESPQWRAAVNPHAGHFVVRQKAHYANKRIAKELDLEAIEQHSRQLLLGLGIPAQEIGHVEQKSVIAEEQHTDGTRERRTAYHVTFVERQIAGLPVLDSRITITHDVKGRFVKARGHWPTIANEGDGLSSTLSESGVRAKALARLSQVDLPEDFETQMAFVLVPSENDGGTVTLSLKAVLVVESGRGEDDPEDSFETSSFRPVAFLLDLD